MYALFPKGSLFDFYFTSLQLVLSAVKRLPVLHHSANYISIAFGIIEPILFTLKIEYCLSRCWAWGGGARGLVYSLANYIAVYAEA